MAPPGVVGVVLNGPVDSGTPPVVPSTLVAGVVLVGLAVLALPCVGIVPGAVAGWLSGVLFTPVLVRAGFVEVGLVEVLRGAVVAPAGPDVGAVVAEVPVVGVFSA